MEAYAFLFTVASIAGMSTIAYFLTSIILNETLADPLVRIPINTVLVSAFLKVILLKSHQRQINLEEDENEDIKEDGVSSGDDGGRSGS